MTRRLLEAVEIGTALAVFGYMSLRAHWNFLGVTSLGGTGIDRYLMETYSILAGELPFLLATLIIGVIAFFAVRAIVRLVLGRRPKSQRSATRFRRAVPVLLLLLLALAQLRILQVLSRADLDGRCGVDVAVGNLAAHAAHHCYAARSERALFHAILVLCVATGIAYRFYSDLRAMPIAVAAMIVVALQLPTLYGVAVKQPVYRAARIAWTDTQIPDTIGLLVTHTADAVEVWTVTQGTGRMVVIPMGELRTLTIGNMRNLLDVARTSANDPRAFAAACGV